MVLSKQGCDRNTSPSTLHLLLLLLLQQLYRNLANPPFESPEIGIEEELAQAAQLGGAVPAIGTVDEDGLASVEALRHLDTPLQH